MIPDNFRPMFAAKTPQEHELHRFDGKWPLYGSPKYDGIRAVVFDGVVYSRTLKPIRSAFVQKTFGIPELEGFDGELIWGSPTDKGCFQNTVSATMTIGCTESVDFYVFDKVSGDPFIDRHRQVAKTTIDNVVVVPQVVLTNWQDTLQWESKYLTQGYEGMMLRNPFGIYKYGRSTLIEGHLVKLKRFEDSEAVILDYVEKYYNRNEPVIDALGLQKRSSSMAGKVPAGVLGALKVQDTKTGAMFELGSGLDDYWRAEFWQNKEAYKGKFVKYKYQPYGVKELPRSPIFLGLRDTIDM